MTDFTMDKKTVESLQRKILKMAEPSLLFEAFGGKWKEVKYPWYIRFARFLLRMQPEMIPDFKMPKNNSSTIKFRRYSSTTEKEEWEERFVIFGGILISALQQLSKNPSLRYKDRNFAKEQLERFNSMVNKTGSHYEKIHIKGATE